VAFGGIILLSLVVRFFVMHIDIIPMQSTSVLDNPLLTYPTLERSILAFGLLGRYLTASLSGLYLGEECSFGTLLPAHNLLEWFAWLLIATTAFGSIFTAKNSLIRSYRIGLLWFFYFFLLTSNVVFPIGTIFGERLAYTPTIGLAAAVALFLPSHLRKMCLIPLILSCAVRTYTLIPIWESQTTLATHHIHSSPKSAKAQLNYAVVLRNKGELNDASAFAHAALQQYPDYAEAAYVLATIYHEKGSQRGTQHWLHKSIDLNPSFPEALNMLGRLESNKGNYSGAVRLFEQSLTGSPRHIPSLVGLMTAEALRGGKQQASEISARLELIAPGNEEVADLRRKLGIHQ
jgi:Tfp pilus assembly protein PilF